MLYIGYTIPVQCSICDPGLTLNMWLLCPVVVTLEQKHEIKTISLFACRMYVTVGAAIAPSRVWYVGFIQAEANLT